MEALLCPSTWAAILWGYGIAEAMTSNKRGGTRSSTG